MSQQKIDQYIEETIKANFDPNTPADKPPVVSVMIAMHVAAQACKMTLGLMRQNQRRAERLNAAARVIDMAQSPGFAATKALQYADALLAAVDGETDAS